MKLSARNQLKGKIVEVKKGVTTTHVRIDVGGQVVTAAANKYRYAVWHDQVLLVDAQDRTVADILRSYVLGDY